MASCGKSCVNSEVGANDMILPHFIYIYIPNLFFPHKTLKDHHEFTKLQRRISHQVSNLPRASLSRARATDLIHRHKRLEWRRKKRLKGSFLNRDSSSHKKHCWKDPKKWYFCWKRIRSSDLFQHFVQNGKSFKTAASQNCSRQSR